MSSCVRLYRHHGNGGEADGRVGDAGGAEGVGVAVLKRKQAG